MATSIFSQEVLDYYVHALLNNVHRDTPFLFEVVFQYQLVARLKDMRFSREGTELERAALQAFNLNGKALGEEVVNLATTFGLIEQVAEKHYLITLKGIQSRHQHSFKAHPKNSIANNGSGNTGYFLYLRSLGYLIYFLMLEKLHGAGKEI